MKKKVLLSLLAAGTIISAGFGANAVMADDNTYPTIITRLAEKFNLNEAEVEAVFDAVHEEHHTEMLLQREDRLSRAVADGVITEEQKNALLEKEREMFENKTTFRAQNRDEMHAWLQEQGIDATKLHEYMGGGMRMHNEFKGRMPMGE